MPEKIPIVPRSTAEHFAIAAITLSKEKTPYVGRGYLEVTLIVDDTEVPFAKTIEDIYRRIHEEVDERAAKLAYETASLKGLDDLHDTIRRYDYELREKIGVIFGVDLNDE